MIRFGCKSLALVILIVSAVAPAAAQRYTAKQDGDVVTLTDTIARMNVAVYTPMGRAWQIQVNGQNLVRNAPSLDAFKANPA